MGARQESLELLKAGLTPGQISQKNQCTLNTTLSYLNQMVGEGRQRRSDILFSIPPLVRKAIANSPGSAPEGIDEDDFRVVKLYGDERHAYGDMYDDLRGIEVALHAFIKEFLQHWHGDSEEGWWRQGIPAKIRGEPRGLENGFYSSGESSRDQVSVGRSHSS